MKARPILFKPDMVNAILEGRKAQTRRVMKIQPPTEAHQILTVVSSTDRKKEGKSHWGVMDETKTRILKSDPRYFSCPYGAPGDLLWVRETFRSSRVDDLPGDAVYQADHPGLKSPPGSYGRPWKPSIHMPRWASRLTLEITDVRVERLQDISEEDARAEGARLELAEVDSVRLGAEASHRSGFQNLWKSINGEESWAANPWVWVVEFQPHHMNVDAFLRGREVA